MNAALIPTGDNPPSGRDRSACSTSRTNRIYFAQRAAEEQELAVASEDPEVAEAHRKMQRAYLERASVGERPGTSRDTVG
jgi:hypothetical protein